MVNKFITSFTAGEISPNLFARVDLEKYASGAALLENYYVDYRGGVSTRAGTLFCGACKFVTATVRLIPFVVSSSVAYVLEVGVGYIRFLANGGYLMTGGSPTEVATPYGNPDIQGLKYSQSADVLTLSHPSYVSYNLTQVTTGVFAFTAVDTNVPAVGPPSPSASQVGGATTNFTYLYAVTSVAADGGESLPEFATVQGDILNQNTGIVNLINWSPQVGAVSYRVYKAGPTPTTTSPVSLTFGFIGETNTQALVDNNIGPDFSATPTQQNDPFSPGQIAEVIVTAIGLGYGANVLTPLTFTGGGGTGAVGWGVTDSVGAIISVFMLAFGKNYTSAPAVSAAGGAGATFTATIGPTSGTYPYCSTYYQQRKVYGGSNNLPQSLSFSRTGSYDNFNQNQIIEDTDGFSVSLAGRQVNYIKSLVPMNTGLIVLTSSGAYLVTGGGANEAITPTSISALPQASSGANDLPPIVVNYDILYGQNRGNVIRDLAFNFYIQSYTGTDRSILASHLFTNYNLQDWTYAEEPYRLVLATRNDGVMLVLTYVPEQQIYAWTHYVAAGASFQSPNNAAFLSVAAIPEGNSNAIYVVTSRTLPGGSNVFYTERFDTRLWTSLPNSWPLDCALFYSGAPATVLSGLTHLNGLVVYALDQNTGLLQGPYTVVAGSITVGVATSKCIVGLPFSTKLNTLEIDLGEDKLGTTQGRRKNITNLTLRVVSSILKGLKASSNGTTGLFQVNDSSITPAQMATFFSGDVYTALAGRWLKAGQVYLEQDLPYPHTILGLIPEITVGDDAQ